MSNDPAPTAPSLVISQEGAAEGAESVVNSNVSIVNALFEEYLNDDEIAEDALTAYYVDYYGAQVDNGGHHQFLVNSELGGTLVTTVGEGLRAVGAVRHAEIFDRTIPALVSLPPAELDDYLRGDIEIDIDVEAADDEHFRLAEEENLVELVAAWLLSRPSLTLVPRAELQAWIAGRAATIDPVERERRREKVRRSWEEDTAP